MLGKIPVSLDDGRADGAEVGALGREVEAGRVSLNLWLPLPDWK